MGGNRAMTDVERHPSHRWFWFGDRSGLGCEACGICTCHSPTESTRPCDTESTDPQTGAPS